MSLEWSEVCQGAMVGVWRHVAALKRNLENKHGASEEKGWSIHIDGALGEMVFGKATGLYWDYSVNKFRSGGDVADIQIRTRSKLNYDLLVRENDADEDLFVLVLGQPQDYQIVGCFYGHEAKANNDWLKDHGGREFAFFVPQGELHDLSRHIAPAPDSPMRQFWKKNPIEGTRPQ
jgi:hypothetical protein